MTEFAATVSGGRVRVAGIVRADAPKPDRNDEAVIVVPVNVKGCRHLEHVGGFPSIAAALAWCDRHLGIAP